MYLHNKISNKSWQELAHDLGISTMQYLLVLHDNTVVLNLVLILYVLLQLLSWVCCSYYRSGCQVEFFTEMTRMTGQVSEESERNSRSKDHIFSSFQMHHLIGGFCGGVTATLITHPFDLIKLRLAGKYI